MRVMVKGIADGVRVGVKEECCTRGSAGVGVLL